MPRPAAAQPSAPTRHTAAPAATCPPPPLDGSVATITTIPANPTTRPVTRIRESRSSSSTRANTAAKKGALFRSTEATAAPARRVPSAMATSVSVMFPAPIASAHAHPARVDGSRAPASRSTGSITSPPASARVVAISAGVV